MTERGVRMLAAAIVAAAVLGGGSAGDVSARGSVASLAPPKPFLEIVAPRRLKWGVITNGSSFTRTFRVLMRARVTYTVRGAWSGGTVAVRISDAAKRTVLARVYSQQHRPTGAIPQIARGRAGRWTFTISVRGASGGPFLIEASG